MKPATIHDGTKWKMSSDETTNKPVIPKSQPNNPVLRFMQDSVLLGLEPSPELGAVLIVYFIQGVMGLSRLAISFFLKDDLGLSPAMISALTGLSLIPWMIKPLYGFVSDSIPLFGYRRRSYLVLAGLLGSLSWILFGTVCDSANEALLFMTGSSLAIAVSDVVVDSIVVERARDTDQSMTGKLQSLCWGTAAFGGLLSAYFSGSLLEHITPRQLFLLSALLPLAISAVAYLIHERPVAMMREGTNPHGVAPGIWESGKAQALNLWSAIRKKSVWMPTMFIFLWQATPSAESAMFFFNTNELGFGAEFLGRVRLVASLASLLGVFLYQRYLSKLPIKQVVVGATLLNIPLGLSQLVLVTHLNRAFGIDDKIFALTDTSVLVVLGQVAFMPVLVLAARICPPGVEATLFATLMSVNNAASALGSELGALLTHSLGINQNNMENLVWLVSICTMSTALVLPFAKWLDMADAPTEDKQPKGPE
eukprot:CAMPEP_0184698754 /NCGR_PEP_ID=MMETSP0313-20130426/5256_1 /TAXON_ID=2792 /ORGANISM="Porphyridium aerugineum, Strain SAG 1380-2" /LENGTH=479 /DNA_ID=CAMNT_0027157729 /DNA_START=173 /DNA_END=1612 /DNA_ORIENTATION=-